MKRKLGMMGAMALLMAGGTGMSLIPQPEFKHNPKAKPEKPLEDRLADFNNDLYQHNIEHAHQSVFTIEGGFAVYHINLKRANQKINSLLRLHSLTLESFNPPIP